MEIKLDFLNALTKELETVIVTILKMLVCDVLQVMFSGSSFEELLGICYKLNLWIYVVMYLRIYLIVILVM